MSSEPQKWIYVIIGTIVYLSLWLYFFLRWLSVLGTKIDLLLYHNHTDFLIEMTILRGPVFWKQTLRERFARRACMWKQYLLGREESGGQISDAVESTIAGIILQKCSKLSQRGWDFVPQH